MKPVVVYPETLSNQAFTTVKGPPQSRYGIIPNTKDRSQDRIMIIYPSFMDMAEVLRTKMNGKTPTEKVMMKLISRAARALSFPFATDTSIEKNMNRAFTRRAKPTLRSMTFRFIAQGCCPSSGLCFHGAA